MENLKLTEKSHEPTLSLSSLRLLVPPLHLLSASMWLLAKQKDVMSYGKLQEFVSTVTEAIPGLIHHRQRAQLLLGLRARFILELCKGSAQGSVDCQVIQSHLDRLPMTSASSGYRDPEVSNTEATFIALVQSLLKDPIERAYFFQEVFPVEYGPQYDAALHVLLWELLSKIEKLLPVPNLKQTAAWLALAPSVLEECAHSSPKELSSVFQQYKNSGLLKMSYGPSSTIGSCIMSALSVPPSQKTSVSARMGSFHNHANLLSPTAFPVADRYSLVAVYAEGGGDEETTTTTIEGQVYTDFYEEEIEITGTDEAAGATSFRTEEMSETADMVKALETLTKTFALRKGSLGPEVATGKSDEALPDHNSEPRAGIGPRDYANTHKEDEEKWADESSSFKGTSESSPGQEVTRVSSKASEVQQSDFSDAVWRSLRLVSRQEAGALQRTAKNTSQEPNLGTTEVSISPSVIAIKGIDKGDFNELTSIIFTCSQCPFHSSDVNSPPHFHMQSVPTEVYQALSGATFNPSPSSSDEIFTSIKLFPKETVEPNQLDPSDTQSGAPPPYGRQKALTCQTCGKTFTRTSDVRRHQLTHTGERPFHCSQCQRTFQHSWDLAKHQAKHHGAAIAFSCTLCHRSFANLRALSMHHKNSHAQESRLPQICSICSQSFHSPAELLEHRHSHVASQHYVCRCCNKGFDSLLARSQHRRTHQVKHQFKCPQCEKTYTRKSDVKRHQFTHTGERPHQCNQCSRRFSLRFMLVKHLRVHTGERPFQCSHCPKRFTLASVLARHERMHTGEKPFLCSQCGKGFLSHGELLKHHRSHVDDKPFSCPQCHKHFKSKKTQQEHMVSHSGARQYPCSHCGKCFTKPYALTRHHLIHTGERPFPCGHCDKSFLTLNEAQLHRRVHTGERPYICHICQLKFKSSSELARHKRRHAGLKRAKPHCEPRITIFTSQTKLKKHFKTHQDQGDTAHTKE